MQAVSKKCKKSDLMPASMPICESDCMPVCKVRIQFFLGREPLGYSVFLSIYQLLLNLILPKC